MKGEINVLLDQWMKYAWTVVNDNGIGLPENLDL